MADEVEDLKQEIRLLKKAYEKESTNEGRHEIAETLKEARRALKKKMPAVRRLELIEERKRRLLDFYQRFPQFEGFIPVLKELLNLKCLEDCLMFTSVYTLCCCKAGSAGGVPRVEICMLPHENEALVDLELKYIFSKRGIVHALTDSATVPNSKLIEELIEVAEVFWQIADCGGVADDTRITVNLAQAISWDPSLET